MKVGIMDEYEECFADDESDNTSDFTGSSSQEENSFEHREFQHAVYLKESLEENECVLDRDLASKLRYSLSSLLYSRFLARLGDKVKVFDTQRRSIR